MAAIHQPRPAFGRYALYGEIASGGMATVHFGRLQGAAGFARAVAIKRLHPQFAKDPDFVSMFVDEARLAARIAHPNVVPTLDVVSKEDELLLVMEYVRGASLSRLLRNVTKVGERVPPRIAAAIVAGVLAGLHAAHEAKSETGERLDIVHRDVSPQNVLVGTDGIARLLDFGVAKATGRWQSTQRGQLKGKIAYMAPEQIATGVVSRRTDLYAAAVVLWETLTGQRLFRADSEAKALALVLHGEVHPPSDVVAGVPPGFDPIVMRGLARDPSVRFANAREMANEVAGVVGIAPPAEVGEWVEHVAADELRERAARIAEMERSVQPSANIARLPGPTTKTATLSSNVGALTGDAESNLAMVQTDATWLAARSRKRLSAAIGATLLLVAGLTAAILALRSARPAPPPEPPVSVFVASPTTPAAAAGAPLPRPEAASASADTSSTPRPAPTTASPPAISTAQAIHAPPHGLPPLAPRAASPAATPVPSPATNPDCRPPYTEDRQGHVHFKPQCL